MGHICISVQFDRLHDCHSHIWRRGKRRGFSWDSATFLDCIHRYLKHEWMLVSGNFVDFDKVQKLIWGGGGGVISKLEVWRSSFLQSFEIRWCKGSCKSEQSTQMWQAFLAVWQQQCLMRTLHTQALTNFFFFFNSCEKCEHITLSIRPGSLLPAQKKN